MSEYNCTTLCRCCLFFNRPFDNNDPRMCRYSFVFQFLERAFVIFCLFELKSIRPFYFENYVWPTEDVENIFVSRILFGSVENRIEEQISSWCCKNNYSQRLELLAHVREFNMWQYEQSPFYFRLFNCANTSEIKVYRGESGHKYTCSVKNWLIVVIEIVVKSGLDVDVFNQHPVDLWREYWRLTLWSLSIVRFRYRSLKD